MPHCYLEAVPSCLVPITEACSTPPWSHFQICSVTLGDTSHSLKISIQSEDGRTAALKITPFLFGLDQYSTKNHPFLIQPGSVLHLLKANYMLRFLMFFLFLPYCPILCIEFYSYLFRALSCYNKMQHLTLPVLFLFYFIFFCWGGWCFL